MLDNRAHLLDQKNYMSDEEHGWSTHQDYHGEGGGGDSYKKVKNKKDGSRNSSKSKKDDKKSKDDGKFVENVMPAGTPGRGSFQMIPKEKRSFWRPEAVQLRKLFKITGGVHALFLVSDIVIFGEILLILADALLLWLDFYNFMILNKIACAIEIFIHVLITLVSITHVQRGLQNEDTTKSMVVIFILQMFVMYPLIAALMAKRLKAHYDQQLEWKLEQKGKTAKGRIKMKIEKKVQEKAAPVVKEKIKFFLGDPTSDDDPNPDQSEDENSNSDMEGQDKKKKFGHRIKAFKEN